MFQSSTTESNLTADEDKGGAVELFCFCPHLHNRVNLSLSSLDSLFKENFVSNCVDCDSTKENWLCLSCGQIRCSRYVNCHGESHWMETLIESLTSDHSISVSLSDLNVWCYICGKYLKHRKLIPITQKLESIKYKTPISEDRIQEFRTGFYYDPSHVRHKPTTLITGLENLGMESPDRLERIIKYLKFKKVLEGLRVLPQADKLPRQILQLIHSPEYLDNLASGRLEKSLDVYLTKDSWDCAVDAASGVALVCKEVWEGSLRNGFAAVRPPGHHALSNKAGGFCLLNNIAIGIAALLHPSSPATIPPPSRVLVFDFDFHHGNGVQDAFYRSNKVLYQSIHRLEIRPNMFFPDEGRLQQVGEGEGKGFNINLGLDFKVGGYTDDDYLYAMKHLFLPIANQFQPELIIVAGGFDSAQDDPIGDDSLTPGGFVEMIKLLQSVESAKEKLVVVLEGGYGANAPLCVEATLNTLSSELLPQQTSQLEAEEAQPSIFIKTQVDTATTYLKQFWQF